MSATFVGFSINFTTGDDGCPASRGIKLSHALCCSLTEKNSSPLPSRVTADGQILFYQTFFFFRKHGEISCSTLKRDVLCRLTSRISVRKHWFLIMVLNEYFVSRLLAFLKEKTTAWVSYFPAIYLARQISYSGNIRWVMDVLHNIFFLHVKNTPHILVYI